MIEIKRNDEKFNLDNVTDEELLEGLKDGIVKSLKSFKGLENIDISHLSLDEDHSFRKTSYGRDGNMYPEISLSTNITMPGNLGPKGLNLLVKPFDIKMIIVKNGITTLQPKELQKAFKKFMLITFPNSDYAEKKQKYDEMAALRDRVYNRMVFGE